MLAKSRSGWLIFILLVTVSPTIAQVFNFRKYQVEDGLSNNTVSCVLQDKKGFVWVGTRDGLNRYDGYHFKIFRYQSNNIKSLRGDFVHCIAESAEGGIWVGTEKGLFKYDEQKENFDLLNDSINYVRDIKITDDKKLWFISGKSFYTGTTLYCYDFKTKEIKAYACPDKSNTTSICIAEDKTLWVSTSTGQILKYNKENDAFTSYRAFALTDNSLPKTIEKICAVSKDLILIGTSRRGLMQFNISKKSFKNLNLINADKSLPFVRDILKYSNEEYWIGTETGIFIYNIVTGKYINLKKSLNDPFSISDNTIYSFWKDYEGGVWVGTFFGGLNYYSKQYSIFSKYFPTDKGNSLSGNIVREICSDQYGNIWIGTEDAGLNKMDPRSLTFTRYQPTGVKSSISYWNIHGLKAIGNELWIGTFEHGLDVMDIKTGKRIRHYSLGLDSNSLKSNFVVTILETSQKEILIGTYSGLYKYNPQRDNFSLIKEVAPDAFVYSLYEDHSGTIWVGTIGDGVYYFDSRQQHGKLDVRLLKKNQQLRNNVVSIFEDSSHAIWLATEGSGITRYNPVTKSVYNYSTENGLPSNFIYKIVQDKRNNLWISSSNGLLCFNQTNRSFKVYNTSNGILNNQFNYNSGFVDSLGNLYFGSLRGMIRFNPEDLQEFSYLPNLYITNIQINNKPVEIGTGESPLQQSIITTSEINLNYNQSNISLDFAGLSFTSPQAIEYAYKLTGVDQDWTGLKTNRRVYFTNLSPGKYTFVVKAFNTNNQTKTSEAKLEIYIAPPWWKTKLAYAAYSILIFCGIYFVFRSYRNRVRFQNEIRFARHQYEKEKEIMDSKVEFFTAVAHEIRTPLTLIVGPLERIIDETRHFPNLKTSLELMERNTNQLLKLTTQLLDFRKIESRVYTINLSEENISCLLQETFESFKLLADNKKLHYCLQNFDTSLYAKVDREALQKILNNLFSNAIKYAEKAVFVELKHVTDKDCLELEIKNDGYIIPDEMHEKIFEPFFRIETSTVHQSGTGFGLTLSRSLAELLGGKLYLRDAFDNLNTFVFMLPLRQPTDNLTKKFQEYEA